jgi:hypothetical protein
VARKSRIGTEKPTNSQGAEASRSAAADPKATSAELKSKGKKTVPKKKAVRAIKPVAPRKASPPAATDEPSDEEIRIRAYFIAERRMQLSLQGDSNHDWIEARRQLVEEANRAAS